VVLEKLADLIIADHARKDIPPGSISWKFIEQSVAKGELEDVEDHRAGRPVGTIREVGSAQPARKGRTPFTAEDDRILMRWCTEAERKGLSLKGNDLYKQLEAKVSLFLELCYGQMVTYCCRIIGIRSNHGGITGSRISPIDHGLSCLMRRRMKERRTANLPKMKALKSDHLCGGSMWLLQYIRLMPAPQIIDLHRAES